VRVITANQAGAFAVNDPTILLDVLSKRGVLPPHKKIGKRQRTTAS